MKRYLAALVLVAAFIWVGGPEAFGYRALTINLPEAYLLEGPGADYRILCKITRDEPLTVLSWEGDWFRVRRTNGMIGWLSRVTLSPEDSARYPSKGKDTAPTGPTTGRTNSSGGFLDSIRTGFEGGHDSTLTASAGGRGIVTENDSGSYVQDYQAVWFMESIVISRNELNRFIANGGLNP